MAALVLLARRRRRLQRRRGLLRPAPAQPVADRLRPPRVLPRLHAGRRDLPPHRDLLSRCSPRRPDTAGGPPPGGGPQDHRWSVRAVVATHLVVLLDPALRRRGRRGRGPVRRCRRRGRVSRTTVVRLRLCHSHMVRTRPTTPASMSTQPTTSRSSQPRFDVEREREDRADGDKEDAATNAHCGRLLHGAYERAGTVRLTHVDPAPIRQAGCHDRAEDPAGPARQGRPATPASPTSTAR